MRSRIISTIPEQVIIYNLDTLTGQIEKITSQMNIKLTVADKASAGEALGYLAGFGGFVSNGSSESADEGCMVFSGLSGKRLDALLAAFGKAEINVPYKAVITASNQSWSIKKLLGELVKEREKLGG